MSEETMAARIEELEEQVRQLTYERRLLGSARRTLDLLNNGGPEWWDRLRNEAGELAQQIVDEIGHPVTGEPALGPSLRAEVIELREQLAEMGAPRPHPRFLSGGELRITTMIEYVDLLAGPQAMANTCSIHNLAYPELVRAVTKGIATDIAEAYLDRTGQR